MDVRANFRDVAEQILNRYQQTSFINRWNEAIATDQDSKPLAFWTRESDDIVNIVWLTRNHIKDITWFPKRGMSTFNFLQVSDIQGIEVREKTDIAVEFGLGITGSYVVDVHASSQRAGVVWVASNKREIDELSQFLGQLLRTLLGD